VLGAHQGEEEAGVLAVLILDVTPDAHIVLVFKLEFRSSLL